MAHLRLSFLGPFQVTLDGAPVTSFESAKVRALLAYLAVVAHRPHPREELAGLLWPDWPQESAFTNLRRALSNLRLNLGDREASPPWLLISREELQFNAASDYWLDVQAFDGLVAEGTGGARSGEGLGIVQALEEAVALYRGPFLAGFTLSDSPPFEAWALQQREAHERTVMGALRALTALYEREGDYARAEAHARRQVQLQPLDEEGQRQLMRALALGGQRSAALAQYQACSRLLAEELGVEPDRETVALYDRIRQERLTTTIATPAEQAADVTLISEPDEGPENPPALFVAREEEMAQVSTWLDESLAGRGGVGFVIGEPGSGKTALAREFARRAMQRHPELVVAWGNGNAYSGMGDPYLPFIEVLAMLTADIEGQRAAGSVSREHARRLRALYPAAVSALLDGALGLVGCFFSCEALLARAQALVPAGSVHASGATWRTRLEETLQRRSALSAAAPVSQSDLFQQVTRFLQALARQQPLLLVLDDLQWADAASIALLFHLGRHLAGSRIIVLGLYRPAEVVAWRDGQAHPLAMAVAELQRLGGRAGLDLAQAEGQRLVNAIVDSEPNRLGARFRETLFARTGGHALFTVEVWRGLQERGDLQRDAAGRWVEGPGLDWQRLPARVEAAVGATVERLSAAWRQLLTVASVEGEEFTSEVVARVLGVDERRVTQALSGPLSAEHRLTRAINLQRLGTQRLSRYRFRHYLFQDHLYRRLDEVERVRLHEEVGLALEALYGVTPRPVDMERSALAEVLDREQSQPAADSGEQSVPSPGSPGASPFQAALVPQLARHFEIAGLTLKALAYAWEEVEKGYGGLAWEEGIAHIGEALQLARALPQARQRARYERKLQGTQAYVLGFAKGWLLPGILQAGTRAYELARQLGPAEECSSLIDLEQFTRNRGDPRLACEYAERAVALAQDLHPTLLIAARAIWARGQTDCGDFAAAYRNLEAVIAPCLGDGSPPLRRLYQTQLWDLNRAAWVLWCLGYPDRASRIARVVLEMSYVTEANATIMHVLSNASCFTYQLRREAPAVGKAVDELCALMAEGHDLPTGRPFAPLYRGWVQVQSGALDEGIATLRRGLDEWDARHVLLRAHWRGYLAEALGMAGRVAEGLALLDEALAEVDRTGNRFSLAETWRLKGELMLKGEGEGTSSPSPLRGGEGNEESAAEACFLKAIAVAQAQEARSWELRATLSLARLWRAQGKVAQAREALAAIYGWFTEGFDTPDLREAKALLEELAEPQGQ